MERHIPITVGRAARGMASAVVDLLFPKRCVGCDREGTFLCAACQEELPRLEPPFCFLCARPGRLMMRLCPRCWERPLEIDGVRAPYRMEGAIREAVHALKYQNVRAVACTLGQLLADFIADTAPPADVLVPVPLHPRRERSRGYNQSLLLARSTGKALGLPVEGNALRRLCPTPSQARSAREEERWANVAGAFEAEAALVQGRRVLLIDDVCTTGATLEACSVALKQAGATSVWGIILGREA